MIKDWEVLGVGFASSFLGSIVKMAGLKMNEKGDIITEDGVVISIKYIVKKSIFGVSCGVIFTGFVSEMIGKGSFNWLMVIGFLIGYGGEHFLPIILKGIGGFISKYYGSSPEDKEGNKEGEKDLLN